MFLSKRISQVNPSATLSITSKAKAMIVSGIDIVSFGAGEPDFDTPDYIKQAAKLAIEGGFTKYTPASGTEELKQAICRKFQDDNGLKYAPEEILVSCGAKHSIFNVILALCDDGDEVILPSPYWVSYPEMVKFSGARPIILNTTETGNFKIDTEELREVITPKTKLLILNSPSNPTGMVYSQKELEAIAKIVTETGIFCLSDEIYEKIIYDDNKHVSIASLGEKIKKQTIVINGVSKAYSMTGWRVGYTATDKGIIKAMSNLQSHSTSNPASISQKAAVCALSGSQQQTQKMVEEFSKRRDYIVQRLNNIEGISCVKPQGAFYVFANIAGTFGKTYQKQAIQGSFSLAELLLSESKVAVIPGGAFGDNNHIRLSYASSMKNISMGLDRIEELVNKLQ